MTIKLPPGIHAALIYFFTNDELGANMRLTISNMPALPSSVNEPNDIDSVMSLIRGVSPALADTLEQQNHGDKWRLMTADEVKAYLDEERAEKEAENERSRELLNTAIQVSA